MLLVSDVHGAFDDLARVAAMGEPLLVLGDLLNFVDYRTFDGMLADVAGKEFVAAMNDLRESGDRDGSRRLWHEFREGREDEIQAKYDALIEEAYAQMRDALDGCEAYVTYGNVDRPDVLERYLPATSRYVDGEVIEMEGLRIGIVGGGVRALGVPGEVADADMAAKLDDLGPVDMLCTHVAPAVRPLSKDVIGRRIKESRPVLDYIREHRPRWHYFGDIHQPQATTWRVGPTTCINVGYFRATGRPVRHG
jgi:Icc-related predicted phosphoesterase